MNHRIPLVTAAFGLAAALVVTFSSAGCGLSVTSECLRICNIQCDTADDCEPYTGQNVDPEDCRADCQTTCDDSEQTLKQQCPNGVDIDGAAVDGCYDAIATLGQVCRDDNESELLEAGGDVIDACSKDFYDCL